MTSKENGAISSAAIDAQRRARFDQLCGSFRPDLVRFCIWLARDKTLAQDVVQETMLRAWKHLDALQDDVAARGWLLTIARRELARVFQRKKLQTQDVDDLSPADEVALASHATPEVYEVRKAIWSLPDDYREPLVMQVLLGYSTQEIASYMGVTQGAVLTRLFRGREKLREILGPSPDDGEN